MKIDCYFPHDVNTLNYQGVTTLIDEESASGYGVYWTNTIRKGMTNEGVSFLTHPRFMLFNFFFHSQQTSIFSYAFYYHCIIHRSISRVKFYISLPVLYLQARLPMDGGAEV